MPSAAPKKQRPLVSNIRVKASEVAILDRMLSGLFLNLGTVVGRLKATPNEATAVAAMGAAFGRAMVEYQLAGPTAGCLAGQRKLVRWKPHVGPPSADALAREGVLVEGVLHELKAHGVEVEEAQSIPPKHRPDQRAAKIGSWLHQEDAVLLPRKLEWGEKLYVMASARVVLASSKKVPPAVGLALLLTGLREALRHPPDAISLD